MQARDIDAIAGPSGTQHPPETRATLLIDLLPRRGGSAAPSLKQLGDDDKARLLDDLWNAIDAA